MRQEYIVLNDPHKGVAAGLDLALVWLKIFVEIYLAPLSQVLDPCSILRLGKCSNLAQQLGKGCRSEIWRGQGHKDSLYVI